MLCQDMKQRPCLVFVIATALLTAVFGGLHALQIATPVLMPLVAWAGAMVTSWLWYVDHPTPQSD